ncbi:thioesterase [Sphingomonas sp. Leaf17]|nr:thioesterase [Sphingomonas sp. Leaf17]
MAQRAMTGFTLAITAGADDIDELGHVNNAVWVQWIQRIATAHWDAVATEDQRAAHAWVVTRHAIDYRGNVVAGETVTGETWVPEPPKGARFDRHVRFVGADGRVKVEAVTTWALIDRATGRLLRVRPDLAAAFLGRPSVNPHATSVRASDSH